MIWREYNLEEEAKRIIRIIKSDFVLPSGLIGLERENGKLKPNHILPDLGDYLPFFVYFMEDDFADEQVNIYEKMVSKSKGRLVSEFPSFGLRNLVKSYEYTDLILGLENYDSHKNTEKSRRLYKDSLDIAIKTFKLDRNISSYFHSKSHLHIPIIDTRDGTFIEIFTEASRKLNNKKYLDVAKNIFERLVTIPFYSEYGLLPDFHSPGWIKVLLKKEKRFNKATMCKNNTNSLFGFLELYKETGDREVLFVIDRMLAVIREKVSISGGISEYFAPNKKQTEAVLTSSFPVLDFLCDLFVFTKRKNDLEFAEEIANFWISRQGKTGLFPLKSSEKESFIDSETDMTIALRKLYEITGKEVYKNSADKCFDGILKYHSTSDYPLSVHIDTGLVINSAQRTKFLALFLKLIIATIRQKMGEKLTTSPMLYNLIKDR